MHMRLVPVTQENRGEILSLQVARDQQNFIETTAQCLMEADQLPLWRPVGLACEEGIVGFAMYGEFKQEGPAGRVWLDRFLIDRRYQGRGYGKIALQLLLSHLVDEYDCDEVYLSLYADNRLACALYEKAGFVFNGEQDINGEKVMIWVRPNKRKR